MEDNMNSLIPFYQFFVKKFYSMPDNSSANNSEVDINNSALDRVVFVVDITIKKYKKNIKKDIKVLKKAKKIFRRSRNLDPGVIRKIESIIEELKEDLE